MASRAKRVATTRSNDFFHTAYHGWSSNFTPVICVTERANRHAPTIDDAAEQDCETTDIRNEIGSIKFSRYDTTEQEIITVGTGIASKPRYSRNNAEHCMVQAANRERQSVGYGYCV
jgi:hypothetical protein